MSTRDVSVVSVDPASLTAKSAKSLSVREGETPWKLSELREVVTTLNSDIVRLIDEFEGAEHELEDLLATEEGAGDDQADAGASVMEREQELAIVNNTKAMLEESIDALRRIEAGTYGTCLVCGNAIGKARLQAFPRALLCVTCKQREERR